MLTKSYNRLSNLCIFALVVVALCADHFPEYKLLFAALAGVAAVVASVNYFRRQWSEIDSAAEAKNQTLAAEVGAGAQQDAQVGNSDIESLVLQNLPRLAVERVVATADRIVDVECGGDLSDEEQFAEYMRGYMKSILQTDIVVTGVAAQYGALQVRTKGSTKRARGRLSSMLEGELLAA